MSLLLCLDRCLACSIERGSAVNPLLLCQGSCQRSVAVEQRVPKQGVSWCEVL